MDKDKTQTAEKPKNEGKAMVAPGSVNSLVPRNFTDAEHIALALAKSDIVPKELIGKPANILLVLMFGAELDLSPAQALQNIMIVNGRPSLWGDAVMGKVEASGLQEAWRDSYDPSVEGGMVSFTTKRVGREPITRTFSMDDAKRANLLGKAGPWSQYPKRMLFHRARSWALRDAYPDVLKGIRVYEEDRDIIHMEKSSESGGTTYYSLPKVVSKGPETAIPATKEEPKAQDATPDTKDAGRPASEPQEATGPSNARLNPGSYTLQKVTGGAGFRIVGADKALYFSENEGVKKTAMDAKKDGLGLDVCFWPGIAQNEIETVKTFVG